MSDEHCMLLYHTDIRWLFRGRVMTHFFELRETIKLFLQLNEQNLSLQGKQMNVITACKKLKAFKLKLFLWSSRIAKDNLANLSFLNRIAKNCPLQNVKHDIIAHLMMLGNSFDGYFSAGELNAAQQ